MKNDPVRIIASVPYIKAWLTVHTLKSNPDAPVWCNLRPRFKPFKSVGVDYPGMRKALGKAVRVHNELSGERGLPKIIRRIHFHAFRYYAQTPDMVAGMPVSIQCKRRGWSPTSRQPMMCQGND